VSKMKRTPPINWNPRPFWEDVTGPGPAMRCWRVELGGGFWLYASRNGNTAAYTATLKHAGGLNTTKSGFRRLLITDPATPMLRWARQKAREFVASQSQTSVGSGASDAG
jgi:hypothetical protein